MSASQLSDYLNRRRISGTVYRSAIVRALERLDSGAGHGDGQRSREIIEALDERLDALALLERPSSTSAIASSMTLSFTPSSNRNFDSITLCPKDAYTSPSPPTPEWIANLPTFARTLSDQYGSIMSHEVLQYEAVGALARYYLSLNPGTGAQNNAVNRDAEWCAYGGPLLDIERLEKTWKALSYRTQLAAQAEVLLGVMGVPPCSSFYDFDWRLATTVLNSEERERLRLIGRVWLESDVLPQRWRPFQKPGVFIRYSIFRAGLNAEDVPALVIKAQKYRDELADDLARELLRTSN